MSTLLLFSIVPCKFITRYKTRLFKHLESTDLMGHSKAGGEIHKEMEKKKQRIGSITM